MFSEYASKFLQQSNARLSFAAQQPSEPPSRTHSRNPLDRRRLASNSRYVTRPGMPNPYAQQAASQSRFPFASRLSRQDPQAPLFYSAAEDGFEEEDEGEVHEREVADYYALQRSRRHFGPSNLTESSEMEDEGAERVEGQDHDREESAHRGRVRDSRTLPYSQPLRDASAPELVSNSSPPSSKGKGRLVDVNLASTIDEEPSESLAHLSQTDDEPPVPFQTFKTTATQSRQSSFLPHETDEEARIQLPHPPSSDQSIAPPTIILPAEEPPRHDAFWATFYQVGLFAMLAAFVLIWFHTSSPSSKKPLGDTIYSALSGSTSLLLWDTLIAVIVALIWLALLRQYIRPLIYVLVVAVPIILAVFSLYPLISSFKGPTHGTSIQDRAMRWLSFIPAVLAILWSWTVVNRRHQLARAISILEFATKLLVASPYLVFLGFATLATTVLGTWTWMLMFERVFLSGHFSGAKRFIIDANAWWLGAGFVLQYLWTLGVVAGVQRATTAATVSQWYFHRFAPAQPKSQEVVRASFAHAAGALFGTICLSTFLSLLVRLPLIILPGRLSALVAMCAYWVVPTSLAALTNPLALTYAAVHSQPLGISARALSQLHFISATNPSNSLGGARNFANPARAAAAAGGLAPYRLSKLLLHATRAIMSLALGFSGWVRTSRSLPLDSGAGTLRGSLYAYIVALIAGTIGFAVLGAVENVVGAVVDALVVCWASETGGVREARFCREAGELFGGETGYGRVEMD